MGSFVKKTVDGKKYLYYSYYKDGKKCEKYCGPDSDPQSRKKAYEIAIGRLEEQKESITDEIFSLEKEKKKIK